MWARPSVPISASLTPAPCDGASDGLTVGLAVPLAAETVLPGRGGGIWGLSRRCSREGRGP